MIGSLKCARSDKGYFQGRRLHWETSKDGESKTVVVRFYHERGRLCESFHLNLQISLSGRDISLILKHLKFWYCPTVLESCHMTDRFYCPGGRATVWEASTKYSKSLSFWYIAKIQPPASIGWVALSSLFVCLSRIRGTSSHLHYMMFLTIQTIYFRWGYDPGNVSAS